MDFAISPLLVSHPGFGFGAQHLDRSILLIILDTIFSVKLLMFQFFLSLIIHIVFYANQKTKIKNSVGACLLVFSPYQQFTSTFRSNYITI